MRNHVLAILALIVMTIGSVGLDQMSKIQAEDTLMVYNDPDNIRNYQGRSFPIKSFGNKERVDGEMNSYLYFGLNYVRNTGAAWGFFADVPAWFRVPFFHTVTFIAVLVILFFMKTTPVHHRLARFALALIFSGAIGNFIDRIRLGYVIDWIDVRWDLLGWRYSFPNFNWADSCISVGVFFLMIDMIFLESRRNHLTQKLKNSFSSIETESAAIKEV